MSFVLGIAIQVKVGYKSLEISVTVSPDLQGNPAFKGLLGNIDGNPDNDFLNSSGKWIPSDSSEEQIFYNFGQSCEFVYYVSTISHLNVVCCFFICYLNSPVV